MEYASNESSTGVVLGPPALGRRLRFKEQHAAKGCFDGAWWPRSREPVTEFSALAAALVDRFGRVDRIGFNPGAWDLAPARLAHGPALVRLAAFYGLQQHTVVVIGPRIHHLTLLVIPPEASPAAAERALCSAIDPDSTDAAHVILAASGALEAA
ncbi:MULTISPECIES: DUF5994 family protein [Amycolatopsis]|uniref:DUF5994 family protein n=1 Tax=Amycolatopsis albidoflavus TaxID=102226 RepID=A0ABW5HUB0_9PSEU|nr:MULTISPECIES: DUF5994 family protein [unclassified Amycolatopsis]